MSPDKPETDAYRNRIFLAYTIAGFVAALLVLVNSADSLVSPVSNGAAVAFCLILAGFTWTGGAVATAVNSADDPPDPWTNRRPVLQSLPTGLAATAVMVAIVLAAMQIPAPGVMYLVGLGFGGWVRWRMKARSG